MSLVKPSIPAFAAKWCGAKIPDNFRRCPIVSSKSDWPASCCQNRPDASLHTERPLLKGVKEGVVTTALQDNHDAAHGPIADDALKK